MDMSISFLLQATRVLHIGNYDDDEVQMIYDYIRTLDNEIIIHYYSNKTILSYENDLYSWANRRLWKMPNTKK